MLIQSQHGEEEQVDQVEEEAVGILILEMRKNFLL